MHEEKQPQKILFNNKIYEYVYELSKYFDENDKELLSDLFTHYVKPSSIEIVILEDNKMIEPIKKNENRNNKINEIIEVVNYLLDKVNKGE